MLIVYNYMALSLRHNHTYAGPWVSPSVWTKNLSQTHGCLLYPRVTCLHYDYNVGKA